MSDDLLIREADLSADPETGTVSGIAVPWDQVAKIGDFTERIMRGAIGEVKNVKLSWRHKEVIGRIIDSEDRPEGFWIRAKISDTAQGRDALTLMRDGVIDKFSVGYKPVAQSSDSAGLVTRSKINLFEVSAVPYPAYANASITEVRSEVQNTEVREDQPKKEKEMTETSDLEIRESVEDLQRAVALLGTQTPAEPEIEYRDAGTLLKALANGDEDAMRAYTGGTTTDSGTSLQNGWVGDLSRLVEGATLLYSLFSKGTLPSEGNYIEYSVLSSNSVAVTGQSAEGEPLTGPGKLTFTTATAPVYTRGGYVSLSRQAIERSSIPVLNHTLRAQAIALGKDLENVVRVAYVAAVAAASARAVTVASGASWANWQGALIDAAVAFRAEGLTLDALVVSTDVFKTMATIVASDGRPVFETNGDGSNTIGTLAAKSLSGQIFRVPVILDSLSPNGKAAFVNVDSIRIFTSGAVHLQDENIIDLTKQFSVHQYVAVAPELPTGIVPVTISA